MHEAWSFVSATAAIVSRAYAMMGREKYAKEGGEGARGLNGAPEKSLGVHLQL